MRFAIAVSAVAVSFLLSANVSATTFSGYVGNRTDSSGTTVDTAGGISASGNAWAVTGGSATDKGVRLDFSATQVSGGQWQYSYSFTQASTALKSLANFDLAVGSLFQASDLVSWNATITDLSGNPISGTPTGPTAGTTAPASLSENTGSLSSPVTRSVTGFRWTVSGLPSSAYGFTIDITSSLAPIWGDFIISAAENTKSDYLAAWNSQLGVITAAAVGNGNNGGYILIPGASVSTVPLPPAVLLLLSGLGFMVLGGARRSRRS